MDPTRVANILFEEVRLRDPAVYAQILHIIRPYDLESVVRLFSHHLALVKDISIFDTHRENIPKTLLTYVRSIRKKFPTPGDAFGIQLTCLTTKSETQETLDSRHLRKVGDDEQVSYNTSDASLRYELDLFTSQTQLFELAGKRTFSTLFLRDVTVTQILNMFSDDTLHLQRGNPTNKGVDARGRVRFLITARFIVVEGPLPGHVRILYISASDLDHLLQHVDIRNVVAFSNIHLIFAKCGLASHFFNVTALARLQLFRKPIDGYIPSPQAFYVLKICRYQCMSGRPLAMNRDGLAKHKERSILEKVAFEAAKRNLTKESTDHAEGAIPLYPLNNSTDKIFFGQQFQEGTGYCFELHNKIP